MGVQCDGGWERIKQTQRETISKLNFPARKLARKIILKLQLNFILNCIKSKKSPRDSEKKRGIKNGKIEIYVFSTRRRFIFIKLNEK